MAVPGSGNQITLVGIFSEKNEDDYTANNPEENNISLRGLSSNSHADSDGGNINLSTNSTNVPDQSAPHAMSEFFGYDHDAAPAFSWGSQTTPSLSGLYTVSQSFTNGGNYEIGTVIRFKNVTASNRIEYTVHDFRYTTQSILASSTTGLLPYSGTLSSLQARWVVTNYDFDTDAFETGGHFGVYYKTTGNDARHASYTFNQDIVTITSINSDGAGTFSDSYRNMVTTNNQDQSAAISIKGDNFSGAGRHNFILQTGGSTSNIGLQLRANGSSGPTATIAYKSGSGCYDFDYDDLDAGVTCIMPDMLVQTQAGELKRIGDIVVGDRIHAQAVKGDDSSEQWVEVTEARTHTRSGYWDVGGIHITNDHPVWLTDDNGSAWVKVEDMRPGISRTYVDGSVDPVYLGTNPGWYTVISPTTRKRFTVSGDYAPTTE